MNYNNLKQVNELQEGDCIVITKNNDIIKEFEGSYEFNTVYFTIPSHYEIIGYIQ